MLQRFTEKARKIVFYAQDEAQLAGNAYVSAEHLLLGAIRDADCVAGRVLEMLGVGVSEVDKAVRAQLSAGDPASQRDMTFTPRAKRVIDLAYDEARNLNNNYIGTEHVLLGLIREGDGVAGRVLAKLGVELEFARKKVMEIQDNVPGATANISPKSIERDLTADTKTWAILHARKQRMIADHLCLLFINEGTSHAAAAIVNLGGMLSRVRQSIENEVQLVKTPEELAAGFLGASEILEMALVEATDLNQELNGAHFLLAALTEGSSATAAALAAQGITPENLRAWMAAHLDLRAEDA